MFSHDCSPAVIHPDPRLAARMMRCFGEELDRALTYTYQHLLTEGLDEESSRLFFGLARREMEHFHTLGRLIRDLGGDPGVSLRLRTPRVDLSEDASGRILPVVRRMLRENLRAVTCGITELESLTASVTDNPWVVDALRRIIREEQEEYEALTELYGRVQNPFS